jgi:hypothetical protein
VNSIATRLRSHLSIGAVYSRGLMRRQGGVFPSGCRTTAGNPARALPPSSAWSARATGQGAIPSLVVLFAPPVDAPPQGVDERDHRRTPAQTLRAGAAESFSNPGGEVGSSDAHPSPRRGAARHARPPAPPSGWGWPDCHCTALASKSERVPRATRHVPVSGAWSSAADRLPVGRAR